MNKEEHKNCRKNSGICQKGSFFQGRIPKFLIEAGIHNKKGELSKHYAH